ncbi:FAD-dependent oxidoreductase [Streptomyces sp. NPDC057565]|uniref:FAD-dependent oxidoreductase n=1 Tax=Streptomyces sp. NPDC057565 TaxID=3346169 RepID=UPI0036CCDD0A
MSAVRTERFDVVVVGSGIAGSSAAVAATRRGARVALLEKQDTFGGSTALSAGMFWTAPDLDAYRRRVPLGDEALGRAVVEDYAECLQELRATGERVADTPKTDIMTFGIGYSTDILAILAWCRAQVEAGGGVCRTGTAALQVLQDADGAVTGLLARTAQGRVRYEAPAVVLAGGGFQGARDELTRAMGPNADRLLLRSNPGSVGDGLRLARQAGASGSTAMSTFYGHLIGAPVNSFEPQDFLPNSQYYSDHAVLVNLEGRRFVDETLGDEILNQALLHQPQASGVLVFDDHVRTTVGTDEPFPGLGAVDRYQVAVDNGALHAQADTLEDLVAQIAAWGIDPAVLRQTLQDYISAASAGGGFAGGHPVSARARAPRTGPFYALKVQPSITFTFGGVRIDDQARVLDADGRPVPGLHAAGADIGGLSNHGYAGGLAPAYITGRRAGRSAARPASAEPRPQADVPAGI